MALIPEPQGFVRNPLTENLDAAGYDLQSASILSASVIETDQIGSILPATKTDVEKTLNFRTGHQLRFAGNGQITLTGLKMNPQAGTTANVLNINTVNDRITYEAFPAGDWYNYPAISDVDMAGYDLQNISLLTRSGTNIDTCDNLQVSCGTSLTIENPGQASLRLKTGSQPGAEFRIPSSGGLFQDRITIDGSIETGFSANPGDILRFDGTTHQWVSASAYSFGSALLGLNKLGGVANQVLRGDAGSPNIGFIQTPSARNTYLAYVSGTPIWRSPPIMRYRTQDMFPMDTYDTTAVTSFTTNANGYWGTVLVPDGRLFMIPFNATQIGIIDTQTNAWTPAGATLAGTNKWAGGCIAGNGLIYCAPATSNDILVINPLLAPSNPNFFTTIATGTTGTLKWRGAATSADGRFVIFNPNTSNDVMRLDTTNNSITFIPTGLTGTEKFGTACLAPNGLIYHTPANMIAAGQAVGITNATAGTFTTFGTIPASSLISRGGVLYRNKIYCPVRSGTSQFYIVDTVANTLTGVGAIVSLSNRYFGSTIGADEKIYCFPYNNDGGNLNLMIIDPVTDTASFRLLATGATSTNNFIDCATGATGTKIYGISAEPTLNCALIRLGVPKLFPWEVNTCFNKY